MENIKLHGSKNIRDLGGIKTEYGTIKKGCILRAGNLAFISEKDADTLVDDYNLRFVIDLRNTAEKNEKPDVEIAGVKNIEMPVFDESVPGLSHETKQDLDGIPDMTQLYRYVVNSDCLFNLAEIIRKIVLYDGEGAVLYHCTEGKDRTGMVTALLLTLLGADRKDIVNDYLFTNTVNLKKAKKYRFLVKYVKRNKTASEKVYNVFIAKEDYINEVFKVIDKYGKESFIKDVLKLSNSDIEKFVKRVCE